MTTLELLNVTIGQQVRNCSLAVSSRQLVCITGPKGAGKTTLLRAVLGFVALDKGYISIDGELLTPQSAPYFRQMMAYVPQHLSVPDGAADVVPLPTGYVALLQQAISRNKPLLLVDEPEEPLTDDEAAIVDSLLMEAAQRGATVLAVNPRITQNQISL